MKKTQATELKKCILTILLVIAIFVTAIFINVKTATYAQAMELDNDEYDIVFMENIKELSVDNYGENIEVFATKELVYDIELNKLGFVYDFYLNFQKGYAIVINTNDKCEVAEIFFNSTNPYDSIDSQKRVYISGFIYLVSENSKLYDIHSGVEVEDKLLDNLKTTALYSGNSTFTYMNETIYYSNKTVDEKQLTKKTPHLTSVTFLSNECAPVAGANIIQYYDRYKPNLISNYTPGRAFGPYYLYNGVSSTTNTLVTDLYNNMGTNVVGSGTSISEFKSGLSNYVTQKGYNTSYASCMTNNDINYGLVKDKIDQGQPIVLFLDVFNMITITENSGNDKLSYIFDDSTHVMAGFGYEDVTYTMSNGQIRKDEYINVATGLSNKATGYLNINYNINIDDVYSINIW